MPTPAPIQTPSPVKAALLPAPPARPIGIPGFQSRSLGGAADLVTKGMRAAEQGNHQQAVLFYTDAISAYPQYGQIYLYRSIAYFDLQMLNEALSDVNRAIELNTAPAISYYDRGTYHLARKDLTAAKDDLHKSIELDPGDYRYHYNLGMAYFLSGSPQAALAAFSDSIDKNNRYASAYIMRASVWCARGWPESAIRDQEAAARLGATVATGCR